MEVVALSLDDFGCSLSHCRLPDSRSVRATANRNTTNVIVEAVVATAVVALDLSSTTDSTLAAAVLSDATTVTARKSESVQDVSLIRSL